MDVKEGVMSTADPQTVALFDTRQAVREFSALGAERGLECLCVVVSKIVEADRHKQARRDGQLLVDNAKSDTRPSRTANAD